MSQASNRIEFLMLVFKVGVIIGRKLAGQGLGFPQLAALYAVSESKGRINRKELAGETGLAESEVMRLLLPLEKTGLIKRELQGRENFVLMTASGKELFTGAIKLAELRSKDLIPEKQLKNLKQVNEVLSSIGH